MGFISTQIDSAFFTAQFYGCLFRRMYYTDNIQYILITMKQMLPDPSD